MDIRRSALTASILLLLTMAVGFLSGCANRSAPEGGPYDETPPRLLAAKPIGGSVLVSPKKITLRFDEIVQVKDALNKVVVSPPQKDAPEISALGKKVVIKFQDSLKKNTTYVINFSDAICDINENTPLKDFTFSFSTGERLDSMRISGCVLDAWTLEPVKDLRVGVHADLADSAVYKLPLFRVGPISERGFFSINNIPDSLYHVFAIQDLDRNFMLSQTGEGLAFSKQVYHTLVIDKDDPVAYAGYESSKDNGAVASDSPASESETDKKVSEKIRNVEAVSGTKGSEDKSEEASETVAKDAAKTTNRQLSDTVKSSGDTVHKTPSHVMAGQDSVTVDSSSVGSRYIYLPNDVVLRYYLPDNQAQKFLKSSHPDSSLITLEFANKLTTLPKVELLDYKKPKGDYAFQSVKSLSQDSSFVPCVKNIPKRPYPDVVQVQTAPNTLTYHLLSPELYDADSLTMTVSYETLDSLNRSIVRSDTMTFHKPKAMPKKQNVDSKKKKKDKKSKKKSKKKLKEEMQKAEEERRKKKFFTTVVSSSGGMYSKSPQDTVYFEFKQPLRESIDKYLKVVEVSPDSTIAPQPFSDYRIRMKNNNEMGYEVTAPWKFGHTYKFRIDSTVLHSYDGRVNDSIGYDLQILKESAFGKIQLKIKGADSSYVVLLLDAQDNIKAEVRADSLGTAVFPFVKPGKWYAKLYVDANNNGRWDVGKYPVKEPEEVYYCPKELLSKENWTVSEEWNPKELPLYEQKPKEIRKVKFAEEEKKKTLNEEYWERMAKKKRNKNKEKAKATLGTASKQVLNIKQQDLKSQSKANTIR